MKNPVQPLFILGSPRSFSSIVCAMIGQHPQTYGVPELNLFAADTLKELLDDYIATNSRDIQKHGLLRTIAQLYMENQTIDSIAKADQWISDRENITTTKIYHELQQKVKPLRIVDKSPAYSENEENLDRIEAAFPNAYYIHLLRHPKTQGESMMSMFSGIMCIKMDSIDYSADPPCLDPQISWYYYQKRIDDFLSKIPAKRKKRLLGEDLLSNPKAYLKAICEWLNVAVDKEAIEEMMHPENSSYACIGPPGALFGNGVDFLKSPHFRFKKITESTLKGSLPWRVDESGFKDEILSMARSFGYK